MDGLDQLAVIGAGLGAGFVMSSIGVASLVSFPVLLALGLPPVVANASNTVGLIPAGLSGTFGYRRELVAHPQVTRAVIATGALGSIAGAFLLLGLPAGVFELVVPWLILFACLLVGLQPWISARLTARRSAAGAEAHRPRTRVGRVVATLTALAGVYGGYFGAGQGVIVVAILALGLDLPLAVVNALKTVAVLAANVVAGVIFVAVDDVAVLAANVVAGVIFVAVADLDWAVIALLSLGSVVGGYVGSRVGRRLPPALFRALVVTAGTAAAITMLVG